MYLKIKQMTNIEYEKYVNKKSPKSRLFIDTLKAFIVGGGICVLGQGITEFFLARGFEKEDTSAFTAIILIFIGIVLTGLGVYDEIGKFSGAGSAVPITGFANSIVSPAIEYKSEGYVMGVGARMFLIAGPVIVYGVVASVVVGIVYYLLK